MTEQSSGNETFSPGEAPGADDRTISDVHSGTPVALAPGAIILDKFKIIGLLGQGGMGTVYRVEHLLVGRQYALKCLHKHQANDGNWRRFQNEAKAAHMLDHASLLRFYDFGLLQGGQPFFLMELVDGITLSDEIKRIGRISVERTVRIFIQVAFAVQYAHDHKVVHRDLKPSNIMLIRAGQENEQETVKVVDFGIAKLTGIDEFSQQTLTKTGEIFGSPLYMSPEQCMGIAVDHRSDLYSLGCVLYESLTGAPPFMGESALSTMMKHQNDKQLSLKEASLGIEFPSGLQHIIDKLLEKNPSDRYQSAKALAQDLIDLERSLLDSTSTRSIAAQKRSAGKTIGPNWTSRQTNLGTTLASSALSFMLGIGLCYCFVSQPTQAPVQSKKEQKKVRKELAERIETFKKPKWSTTKNGIRVFQFPERNSLGLLVMKDDKSFAASDKVTLPANEPLALLASDYLLQNPKLFDQFRADDLTLLDFCESAYAKTPAFSKIAQLKSLKALNLSSTDFSDKDLEFLRDLPNLRHLELAMTDISCAHLLDEPFLEQLNLLDVSAIDDGHVLTQAVSRIPNIQQLGIAGCGLVNAHCIALAKCKSLKVLTLAVNGHITNKGVANLLPLKQLEWLDLSMTSVTPAVSESLKQFPHLKKIEISHIGWEPSEMAKFIAVMTKHNPSIEIIRIDLPTYDPKTSIPGLPWPARGLEPHINFTRM